MKAPCKDCTERHLACHDSCEAYLDVKRKNTENKAIADKRFELFITGRTKLTSMILRNSSHIR